LAFGGVDDEDDGGGGGVEESPFEGTNDCMLIHSRDTFKIEDTFGIK